MEEMDFCEYLPGGKSHERCQGRLAEFRRGMAEAIGTFALVLVSCLASASPYSTDISTLASLFSHSGSCCLLFVVVSRAVVQHNKLWDLWYIQASRWRWACW
jgi:hypothetical protein